MFNIKIEADYYNSFKSDMLNYLRSEMPRKELGKDFIDFLGKIDSLEEKIREINSSYAELEKKYMLLFTLKDFRNLFQDKSFKQEMINYIKYKEEAAVE